MNSSMEAGSTAGAARHDLSSHVGTSASARRSTSGRQEQRRVDTSDDVLDFIFGHYSVAAAPADAITYPVLLRICEDTAMLDRLTQREAVQFLGMIRPKGGQRITESDFRLIVDLLANQFERKYKAGPDEAYHHLCSRMLKAFIGKYPYKLPKNMRIPQATDARPTTVSSAPLIEKAQHDNDDEEEHRSVSATATPAAASRRMSRDGANVSHVAQSTAVRTPKRQAAPALPSTGATQQRRHSAAQHSCANTDPVSASARGPVAATAGREKASRASPTASLNASRSASNLPPAVATVSLMATGTTTKRPPPQLAATARPPSAAGPGQPNDDDDVSTRRRSASARTAAEEHESEPVDFEAEATPPSSSHRLQKQIDEVLADHRRAMAQRATQTAAERFPSPDDAYRGYRPRGLGVAADQCRAFLDQPAEAEEEPAHQRLCARLGVPSELAPLFERHAIATDDDFWASVQRCSFILFPAAGCAVVAEELAFQRIFDGAMTLLD